MQIKVKEYKARESDETSLVYTLENAMGYHTENGVKRNVYGGYSGIGGLANKQFRDPEDLIDYVLKKLRLGKKDQQTLKITTDSNDYRVFITFAWGTGNSTYEEMITVKATITKDAKPNEYVGEIEQAISNRG